MTILKPHRRLESAQKAMAGIYGLPAWDATLGYGSFLTAEFGAPGAGLSGKRGQYLLWVYMTAWRIETAGR